MSETENHRLLVEIAYKYYEDHLNQSQIAKEYHISRSLVSRYLTKARELGIVEFVIHDEYFHPHHSIEEQLINTFGLNDAVIVDTNEDKQTQKRRIASAAGKYLTRKLQPDSIVGLAGGTTIHETANAIPTFTEYPNVTFVSMVGGLGDEHTTMQSNFICDKFATRLNAKSKYLYAPVLVDSIEAKEVFLKQTYIKNVMTKAKNADFALLGIGGDPKDSSIATAYRDHLNAQDDFNQSEIIGDLCYNFIDKYGELVECEWNKRVISLGIDHIREIPNVIGIAGGINKVSSISAVLNAKLIDTLVTDEKTAQAILDYSIGETK